MICSSVNLLLRIVCLLGGEQNPNSKPGAFQGSRSLLELFVRDILNISAKELNELKGQETLDNRQIDLIRGLNGEVNYFRRQKARFDERNLFEKTTFMLGATCLPKDEFETWIGAVRANMARPLEKLFCDWVKTKHGRLYEVLATRSNLAKE
jgi:hypothetical protein